MAEYINRDALLQEIEQERRASKNSFPRQYFVVGDVLTCIRTAPAADVAEVRHGRWIPEACESISKRNRLIEYRVYSCSICGRSNGRVKKRYCPNCGARMDKEDEHEAG